MSEEPRNLTINSKLALSEEQTKALSQFVSILYTIVFPNGSKSLKEMIVIEDDLVEGEVNRIFSEYNINPSYKKGKGNAVTIPLYYSGKFFTIIIIGSSKVPQNENDDSFSKISSILEELMHVKLYEEIHEIEDCFCNKINNPVNVISFQIVNEYVVNCRKYGILTDIYGTLGVNTDLIPKFSNLEGKLFNTINNAAAGIKPISESCTELLTVIYRDLFEPLTRYLSGYDSLKDVPEIEFKQYKFLDEVVFAFWNSIRRELQKGFEQPELITETITNITDILTKFLRSIGVTYRELDDGSYYFHFDNSFFVERGYMKKAFGSFPFKF